MSAEKRLKNNVDVLETLLQYSPPYEVQVNSPRGSQAKVRVSIGRKGEDWSRGEGNSFPVALDRAVQSFKRDYYQRLSEEEGIPLARVASESEDYLVDELDGIW